MQRTMLVIATTVALLVGGCSAGEKPDQTDAAQTPELKAGVCVEGEVKDLDDIAPDPKTIVDCSKPHVWEITAVADLPKELLSGGTQKQRLAHRSSLGTLDAKTQAAKKLRKQLRLFMRNTCGPASITAFGLDAINETVGNSAGATVAGDQIADMWSNLSSPTQWRKGQTQVICSTRFQSEPGDKDADPVTKAVLRSAKKDRFVTAAFATSAFPAELRRCFNVVADDKVDVASCTEPHYAETLFAFDAAKTMGSAFVRSIAATDGLTDRQDGALRATCRKAFPALLGADYDKNQLGAIVDYSLSALSDDPNTWLVTCSVKADARSGESLLPGGSLFENAKDVQLVKTP